MQQDALKRLNLTQMLFEKETLENVEADVRLVATLMTLSKVIPAKTKDTARQVVRKVVEELMKKLAQPTQQAIAGPAIKTRMVVFDTAVVDLTEELSDPVELLFGVQLGGGTDINLASTYCQQLVTRPQDTVKVLVTNLFEGGDAAGMRKRAAELVAAGVQLIVLPALNDDGAPSYDHGNAQFLADLGVPVFARTPDKFPDFMAAALSKQDVAQWAAKEVGREEVAATHPRPPATLSSRKPKI